eukprot:5829436-Alexandrium_andersonii.AAC.1
MRTRRTSPYTGDVLCKSCSYALRHKRFLVETQPPDDMPAEYRRHLAEERADALAMGEINLASREERGIKKGH